MDVLYIETIEYYVFLNSTSNPGISYSLLLAHELFSENRKLHMKPPADEVMK